MTPIASSNHMDLAFAEAEAAANRDEVPVGAVIVERSGQIIARAGNRIRELGDPTAHAEMLAIRDACRSVGSERLVDHALYVTLEPCAMCAAAISFARIARLYYGAMDAKSGGVEHGARVFSQVTCHHAPEVYSGFQERRARELLQNFFVARRD